MCSDANLCLSICRKVERTPAAASSLMSEKVEKRAICREACKHTHARTHTHTHTCSLFPLSPTLSPQRLALYKYSPQHTSSSAALCSITHVRGDSVNCCSFLIICCDSRQKAETAYFCSSLRLNEGSGLVWAGGGHDSLDSQESTNQHVIPSHGRAKRFHG